MKKLFLLLIFIIPIYGLTAQENINFPELLPIGQQAPEWELENSEGELIRLSDYREKIILIDFWASWCVPCIRAQPLLEKIHQENKDVVVLGINVQEVKDLNLNDFKNKNDLSYQLVKGSEDIVKNYKVEGLPVVYLIDRRGYIIYAGVGYNERKKAKILDVIQQAKK